MFKQNITLTVGMICLSVLIAIPSTMAQQKTPEILAEVWVMVTKQGKSEDLEKAIKSILHIEKN
jgi:hypothetical protein